MTGMKFNNSTCVYNGSAEDELFELNLLDYEKAIVLIPVMVFMVVLMVVGILGNALVIYVYQYRFKRTPSNRFIIWMAILDLFTCLIGVPFEIFDLARPYTFDRPWGCKFLRLVSSTAVVASSLVLIAVAFDRYFKAFKPFKRLTIKSTNIFNGLALLIGLILSLPALFIFGMKATYMAANDGSGNCLKGWGCSQSDKVKGKPYAYMYYGILLLVYIVLLAFQIALYGRLGREIFRRKKANKMNKADISHMKSVTCDRESTSFLQRDIIVDGKNGKIQTQKSITSGTLRKISAHAVKVRIGRTTLIFFCVSVAFIVSFLPHIITKILQATIRGFDDFSSNTAEVIYNFCTRSQFINNAINPVIYGFLNPNFREHCAAALASVCGKKKPADQPETPNNIEVDRRVSQSC